MSGVQAGVFSRRRGRLLATGQLTSYSGENDDGALRKGLLKSYTILTLGQYSLNKNIDLTHAVSAGADISFNNNNPAADTITSTVLDFTTFLVAGDVIVISNATDAGNNVAWTIAGGGVAAHTVTLTQSNVLTTRVNDANAITFAKREVHSNECILDNNTGLMWSRYVAANMGTTSNGKMPWTGQSYDIFAYAAACNVALLGGYSDWRIPNLEELMSLFDAGSSNRAPNSTAFPLFPADAIWTSSTDPNSTTLSYFVNFTSSVYVAYRVDRSNDTIYGFLVRGG